MIVLGADMHKGSHTVAAVAAATGEVLGEKTVAVSERGFVALLDWARSLGEQRVWALEDCRHVSGSLERFLLRSGERVIRVATKLIADARRGARSRGKSDAIDALAVARAALREGLDGLPAAQLAGPELDLRLLGDHRMRHTLIDERTQWMQRIQATLYHHGVSGTPEKLRTRAGRAFLAALDVPADARERIEIALAMVEAIDAQIAPLERELRQLARRQTGCRALMGLYGMGELTSLVTLCELGDVARLSASRKAVRMAGIDIGVYRSDRRARVGKLNRQGSPHLRWALYEAALAACRHSSPDHADYLALKARGL